MIFHQRNGTFLINIYLNRLFKSRKFNNASITSIRVLLNLTITHNIFVMHDHENEKTDKIVHFIYVNP